MIGVGGVLGQTTEGARDLVQNGVQTIEDSLRDIVVAQVIPESTGNLLDLLKNSREVMMLSAPLGRRRAIRSPSPRTAADMEL